MLVMLLPIFVADTKTICGYSLVAPLRFIFDHPLKQWATGKNVHKFEYLKNKKNFLDEIKRIFHNYLRAIIWLKNEK